MLVSMRFSFLLNVVLIVRDTVEVVSKPFSGFASIGMEITMTGSGFKTTSNTHSQFKDAADPLWQKYSLRVVSCGP